MWLQVFWESDSLEWTGLLEYWNTTGMEKRTPAFPSSIRPVRLGLRLGRTLYLQPPTLSDNCMFIVFSHCGMVVLPTVTNLTMIWADEERNLL